MKKTLDIDGKTIRALIVSDLNYLMQHLPITIAKIVVYIEIHFDHVLQYNSVILIHPTITEMFDINKIALYICTRKEVDKCLFSCNSSTQMDGNAVIFPYLLVIIGELVVSWFSSISEKG